MVRVDQIINARGVAAALVAATLLSVSALAQAPKPVAPSAATKPVTSAPGASAKGSQLAKKRVVSPYARAASQREHAGQAPLGHAPSMVQGMGKPRKPHPGAPSK
jgi:predicted lipoprotein